MSDFRKPKLDFTRRDVMTAVAVGAFAASAPGLAFAGDKPTLVTSIRSLSNPYHAVWKQGAEAFAKSIGLDHVTLVSEANSEKGIADIRAMLAKTGGNMVLNSDPNDTPDARPIVESCFKAGAYVVTQWNKPSDLHPEDFNPYYVSHIEFDGVASGTTIAEILFKTIGGSGGIVALGGMISTTAAIERKKGLDLALAANPNIKLLDFQVANWKSTEAYELMGNLRTRFGDQIKGVWAANDDMGIGALEVAAGGRCGGQDSDRRRGRHQGCGRGSEQGGIRVHDHFGSVLAGRHGPLDRAGRQDEEVRPRQGTG